MEKTFEEKLNNLIEEHLQDKYKQFDNSFEVGFYNGIEYAFSLLEERDSFYKVISKN